MTGGRAARYGDRWVEAVWTERGRGIAASSTNSTGRPWIRQRGQLDSDGWSRWVKRHCGH